MPVVTIPRLLLSILSLIILAAAVYLLYHCYQGHDIRYPDGSVRHVGGRGWEVIAAAGLLGWSFLGRAVILMFIPGGKDDPREERGEATIVSAPDGSGLNVESFGKRGAPTLVLTHGWGLDSTAWWHTKQALVGRYRLVTWDLPGLGRSKSPKDGKFTIDRFAEDLGEVVKATGSGPVILVGHSIGGMATQTFWRTSSEALKARIAGVILIDTTHENPLRTMWLSSLWLALRWPVIEPMSWLTIALSPLVWLLSWQGYLSGSNQLAMRLTGFGRHATRGQVDFTARLACEGAPSVQAKGNLAMFRWRVTEVLPRIDAPLLVLSGSSDIVTLPRASETIVGLAPRGRLQTVEGAGHMGFMEAHGAYNEAIAAFADEVFAGARGVGATAS